MKFKSMFAGAALGFGMLTGFSAQAIELAPYSAQTFSKAQQDNKAVALHFHAEWCSTCRVQESVLKKLEADKSLDVLVLVVDYDKEKDLKKAFKVPYQSTFVVFKGKAETGRILGDTAEDKIRVGLSTALKPTKSVADLHEEHSDD